MTIQYMKTTKETKAGTYRMRRVRGHIMVSLTPKIGGEGVVGMTYTIGRMEKFIGDEWRTSNVRWHKFSNEDGAWERKAENDAFYASSTPSALRTFVALYDEFFIRTLLEYEGEVFNPITNETRIHYGSFGDDEPLHETWIRISDDEDALARIWNNEFKKLANAVVPVKRWDNHDDHTRRPQNNIWAVIDREHTAALGMSTGVGLPPHLWTIIDPDTEKAVPIIDPADEDARLEREHQERVEANEEADRLNAHLEQQEDYSAGIAYPERKKQPVGSLGQPIFEVGKTYTNWPHRNATCRVIDVGEGEVRVELKNSNGNIVRRWAEVKWRRITLGRPLHPFGLQDTDCILVDVEPFNMPCFNACDIVEVDA